MKFSDGEKLILIMLSDLYDKLNVKGEIDHEFIKSAISSNNTWGIPWKYSGIQFDQQDTPDIVREVADILDMWFFIERCYNELSPEEKETVKKEAYPFGDNPMFPGFDGNNESEHMGIAIFLLNDLDRFQEFKGRYLNSHGPTIEGYRRMLPVFKSLRQTIPFKLLSANNLVTILKERIHPDSRE